MPAPQRPVIRLSGVGPGVARDLARAGIERVADLLWLLPVGYDDLSGAVDVTEAVRRAPERPWLAVKGRVRSANIAFVRRRGKAESYGEVRAPSIVSSERGGYPAVQVSLHTREVVGSTDRAVGERCQRSRLG